jgi:hypothetical protein
MFKRVFTNGTGAHALNPRSWGEMQTHRRFLLAAGAVVALAAASQARAQDTATTSASADVAVLAPTSVAKDSDLSFGRVIRPSSGNTIYTVDAATGAPSTTGGDGAFFPGGSPGRATFTAYGSGGAAFTIAVDPSVVVDGITINLVKSAGSGTLGAGATGTATFGVGGNVTLGSTSALGTHSGTFVVTVNYP